MRLKPGPIISYTIRQLKLTAIKIAHHLNCCFFIAVHFSERIEEMKWRRGFNPILKHLLCICYVLNSKILNSFF